MTIRIKPRKPVISDAVRPVRKVRRLMMNQTDYPILSGCVMHLFVLALLSATLSLTGITAGMVMRFVGL